MDTSRFQQLMSDNDHDALLLGLIHNSQSTSMPKEAAFKEQANIKGLFNQIKNRNFQNVEKLNSQLATLKKRRTEILMKNSLMTEVKQSDRGNKMKMLNLVEQSIYTFIKNASVEMKLQKKQLNLQDKKDDMIKMM